MITAFNQSQESPIRNVKGGAENQQSPKWGGEYRQQRSAWKLFWEQIPRPPIYPLQATKGLVSTGGKSEVLWPRGHQAPAWTKVLYRKPRYWVAMYTVNAVCIVNAARLHHPASQTLMLQAEHQRRPLWVTWPAQKEGLKIVSDIRDHQEKRLRKSPND